MRTLCVIPARLASTRLAHKPLQAISNKPLIRLVAQRALDLACFDHVVVATDDARICAAVDGLAVEPVVTGRQHSNGTERVAEVAGMSRFADFEIVVNLQGDEPFVSDEAVLGAIARVQRVAGAAGGAGIGTAGATLSARLRGDPNTVKVFVDGSGRAVGFSRRAEPSVEIDGCSVWHHVGVYAYHPVALRRWVSADPAATELEESLEQLRPLSYGEHIGVATIDQPPALGINTAEDLRMAEHLLSVSS